MELSKIEECNKLVMNDNRRMHLMYMSLQTAGEFEYQSTHVTFMMGFSCMHKYVTL